MDLIWIIAIALITYTYFGVPSGIEPYARLQSYGHPYYWKLRYLAGGRAGDCHYKHYDNKCNCVRKNVIYLD